MIFRLQPATRDHTIMHSSQQLRGLLSLIPESQRHYHPSLILKPEPSPGCLTFDGFSCLPDWLSAVRNRSEGLNVTIFLNTLPVSSPSWNGCILRAWGIVDPIHVGGFGRCPIAYWCFPSPNELDWADMQSGSRAKDMTGDWISKLLGCQGCKYLGFSAEESSGTSTRLLQASRLIDKWNDSRMGRRCSPRISSPGRLDVLGLISASITIECQMHARWTPWSGAGSQNRPTTVDIQESGHAEPTVPPVWQVRQAKHNLVQ